MTRRERLARCFSYRETDRPAVYSRAGFPAGDSTYDRLKAYLDAHAELKAVWASTSIDSPDPVTISFEPYSADFQRRVEILHTPAGDLRRTVLVSLQGLPGLAETFFVNSPEDAERYLSLPLPEPGGDVSSFFAADAAIGDKGITDVGLGLNPGGSVASLCGSRNFALMSVTDREMLHRLCRRRLAILTRRLKFLLAGRVGPYFSMEGEEYIVPPLHGPKDFADFNVKYDKPLIALVHEAGGRAHIHSHGSIRRVFQGFLDTGVDVLHPFEPPPQGDIFAREAKALARGRLCLEGNIQIHRMYEADPAEIRQETEQLMRDAFDDRAGLIVSPTASPYIRGRGEACFSRYKAMIDAVLTFGK